ncbi:MULTISPECIES: hypothetical protein [Proteus]|uniref:hypothetical protein n=1 Tax=Proteus TaxID=583 RepID=UPI0018E490D3|nr:MULTISPECIES: hypothetical protein [Proteus]MBI6406774.1 hypothetical protein [Proteus sp. PR00208]
MDKIIELIITNQIFQWMIVGIILVVVVMFVTLFIQYNIDRVKGRYAKFLWFEVNRGWFPSDKEKQTAIKSSLTGKNINTGQNYGVIGDKYTGLKQREVTSEDVQYLAQDIAKFSKKYADKINHSHITLGYPGCKETTNLANQLHPILKEMGFNKIKECNLQTYGAVGRKFGVSNAPDNSIMIEIFPADNVE